MRDWQKYYLENRAKLLERAKQWRINNAERHRANQKAWGEVNMASHKRKRHAELRAQVLEAYGGKCTWCELDVPELLDVDHINDDAKLERLKSESLLRHIVREGFPKDRYQLLCRNCNYFKEVIRRRAAQMKKGPPVDLVDLGLLEGDTH